MFHLKQHMRSNKGDANVSKMTIIAIVFVVGAILLVLTTSAFRNPINRWFDKVTAGWFQDDNGMFEADNQWLLEERHENGTYKNAVYIIEDAADNFWILLDGTEAICNGSTQTDDIYTYNYFGGHGIGSFDKYSECTISADGRTIIIEGVAFHAYLPGDPNIPNTVPNWMINGS